MLNSFCMFFGITPEELTEKKQTEEVVRIRKIFCGYTIGHYGPSEVARVLGQHHSTVIHHRKEHNIAMSMDQQYHDQFIELRATT